MLLGVVSDTHGQMAYTQRAVESLAEHDLAAVLHCGDIGSWGIVDLFAPWPTHFVLGNVDDDYGWQQAMGAGHTFHGRFGTLDLGGVRIAFLHGDDGRRLHETIHSGQYQLVCHGHTHVARQDQIGTTLVLNPGALYRAFPHTCALVELPSLQVRLLTV